MKKKILVTLAVLVVLLGIVYFMGFFDGGTVTEEDKKAGEDISNDKEMNRAIDNAPMPNFEEEENSQDDEEDFDPESML